MVSGTDVSVLSTVEGSENDPNAAALSALGIEADATDLAVIGGAQALFGPAVRALLELDIGDDLAERDPDLSRPPGAP
jgi:hypothetical protein